MIEPRETVAFDLDSLIRGGDGLSANVELLALAPHLGCEMPISSAEARLLECLQATPWQSFENLAERYDPEVLHSLLEKGLLLTDLALDEDGSVSERDARLRAANWHPHAAITHYFGRWRGIDSGAQATQAGVHTMSDLAARLGPPPSHLVERVEVDARIGLPMPPTTSLDDLLTRRVTCRNFDPDVALPLATFSHMLARVFRAQASIEIVADNVVIKRTSPSGGSLHPIEAYLLVQNVEDIAPGLYHYHCIDHALEQLRSATGVPLRDLASQFVAAQTYFADAHVQVMLVARFPRTFWKYRNHSKAYRVCVLDAGHLSQTLYLSATELGLGAFITAAINEVDVEQAFGLDELSESPIAICGFGIRASTCQTVELDPQHRIWTATQTALLGLP